MDIRYTNNAFQFLLRVSALIYNEDESKILIFNVNGRDFYLLPGGKINELEESINAIKREIKEELGWDKLDFQFLGVCEELVNFKGYDNHQIDLIYKSKYKTKIEQNDFKGLEGDWINFKWVDIKEIDQYNIYPKLITTILKEKEKDKIYHAIDNMIYIK